MLSVKSLAALYMGFCKLKPKESNNLKYHFYEKMHSKFKIINNTIPW